MSNQVDVDTAFNKWWRDFNADSDEMPGSRGLAFAAFAAGFQARAGVAQFSEGNLDDGQDRYQRIPAIRTTRSYYTVSRLTAAQLSDVLFRLENALNAMPETAWSVDDVERVVRSLTDPLGWIESGLRGDEFDVPPASRELSASVMSSKIVGQLAKIIDRSCAELMVLRDTPPETVLGAQAKVLRNVRYAANDLRRELGQPHPHQQG
jgi:hypothetical protein